MSMMRIIPLSLALALALSPGLHAAEKAALPAALPAYGADKPLPVPAIEKKTLANGLEVWVVPRQGVPRVDYVLALREAGLAADPANAPGFASLFAGLLTEGTGQHDARQIAELAQGMGGGLSATASNDAVFLSAHALASHGTPMLQLLAEVARQPTFPENEVRLAQANAAQQLKASESQPSFRASRALLKAVYGEHPYARTQLAESTIPALTHGALEAAHQARFQPKRALLVITGRVTPAQAFAEAERAFGDWKAEGKAVAATPKAPSDVAPTRVVLQRDGSVQSTFRIGRPAIAATDADYVPMQLASTVLGSGISSRLNQNLREEKGYTYGAGAGLAAAREGGNVIAQADVRNEVTGASLKEFFHEFQRLGQEPVPAKELDAVKRYVAGGYLITNQLQGSVALSLARNWAVGLPAEFLGQYVPKIRKVDAATLQQVAKRYWDPAQQSVVVVGDAAQVAEQLKPFGTFKIER